MILTLRATSTRRAACLAGLMLILSACGGERGPLADGEYTVAFDAADALRWRPFLQVRVRRGRMVSACFDAVGPDGGLRSVDEQSIERMRAATGTEPLVVAQALERALLESVPAEGPVPVAAVLAAVSRSFDASDSVNGAALTRGRFLQLAHAFLDTATAGAAPPDALIVVALNERYVVEDQPDERGWTARLALEYRDGDVAGAELGEYRHGPNGVTWKRDDTAYAAAYAGVHTGLTPAEVYDRLIQQLRGWSRRASSPPVIDAVSGATGTSERAAALLERIAEIRTPAPVPDRACRAR